MGTTNLINYNVINVTINAKLVLMNQHVLHVKIIKIEILNKIVIV